MKRKPEVDGVLSPHVRDNGSKARHPVSKSSKNDLVRLTPDRIRKIAYFFDGSSYHTLSALALCDIASEVRDHAHAWATYCGNMTPDRMREIAEFLYGAQWYTLSARQLCDIADEFRDFADAMEATKARRKRRKSTRGRTPIQGAPLQTFA